MKTGVFLATAMLAVLFSATFVWAEEADVVNVQAYSDGPGRYRFEVTVRHADQGWDHYADRWEVLSPEGDVLGVRVLHHPHVNEQPFTRSLSGVPIPEGMQTVRVRARDSVHGYGGAEMEVTLPKQ